MTAPSCPPFDPEAGEGADLPPPCFYFSLPSERGAVQCSQLRVSALESKLRAVVSQKGGVRNVMARYRKERERKSPVEFGRFQKRENAIQMEL